MYIFVQFYLPCVTTSLHEILVTFLAVNIDGNKKWMLCII